MDPFIMDFVCSTSNLQVPTHQSSLFEQEHNAKAINNKQMRLFMQCGLT